MHSYVRPSTVRPSTRPVLALTLALTASALGVSAGTPATPVMRLTLDDGDVVDGKLLAHNQSAVWVLQRSGALSVLDRDDVRGFSRSRSTFAPESPRSLQRSLRKVFPDTYDVVADSSYVVVAPHAVAGECLRLFSDVERKFRAYFDRRTIRLEPNRFPLVAIVFATQEEFEQYAEREDVDAATGLVGYYLRTSNRVALYLREDDGQAATARQAKSSAEKTAGLSVGVRDTIVHEAIHQLSFNSGLHSRVGENPIWVVEGLATMLEGAGLNYRQPQQDASTRINQVRFRWWAKSVRPSWQPGLLGRYLADDAYFREAPLDAYSIAWALSFYLNENEPVAYARYLRTVSSRTKPGPYPEQERLRDVINALGGIAELEVKLLRAMDGLSGSVADVAQGPQ